METKPTKINLPALCANLELSAKVDSLNTLLNQRPPQSWLKTHKGVQYQPVERVKNNLITIFQDYDWEIKNVQVVANSILVYGDLYVINPITGRTRKVSGIGAWPIQLKAGSNPTDFQNIVQDAIQKNAPAAESLALKNAAKKLGELFGDGKEEEVVFNGVYANAQEAQLRERVENFDESTLDTELKITQAAAGGLITKDRAKALKAQLKGVLVDA